MLAEAYTQLGRHGYQLLLVIYLSDSFSAYTLFSRSDTISSTTSVTCVVCVVTRCYPDDVIYDISLFLG